MKKWLWRIGKWTLVALVILGLLLFFLTRKAVPEEIIYGMSFNTVYANELGLDWLEAYDAIIDDLGVRHLRLAAHWPMIEPEQDEYSWMELDYQLAKAESVGAEVVLAVGRRLPRWPECHVPDWASEMTWYEQQQEILNYMQAVVERYKDREVIKYWQVENEPFLTVFAYEHCGDLDERFLEAEVAFVKSLDPTRPVLVTDSGNLGLWSGAYRNGDAFGTSVYVYLWNPEIGPLKTILPPWWYRMKDNLMMLRYGEKETMLIELSAEPWLLEPVVDAPIETQLSRMDLEKLKGVLDYAEKTRFEKQYLWGAEWWYWLAQQERPELWEFGKTLFSD